MEFWLIVCLIIAFYVGVSYGAENDGESNEGLREFIFFIVLLVSTLILWMHYEIFSDTHRLWGVKHSNYKISDHVILPDGSAGKVDDIYYYIEGDLFAQDSLKLSK